MTTNTKRKILLAVSGLSPQIVTETMYALVTREDNPWIPDEVHLLSTKEGCDRAKNELLHESRDMFGQFCREYLPQGHQIKFDEQCLHTFERNGVPLSDIRDLEDSALVADAIAAKVWELTSDENTEIHASIAGGRKSMGFLLGYSMSLYGRPQDRLSHVLVNEGFEGSTDFYFPPKKSVIIHDRNTKPLDTADAVVSLAIIPILHLRGKLPRELVKSPVSFAKLVDTMNLSLIEPSIEIDEANRTLKCHGVDVQLSPLDFSFYLFMAQKTKELGNFRLPEIDEDEFLEIKERFLDAIQIKENRSMNKKAFDDGIGRTAFFDDRKNRIKKSLEDVLGIFAEKYVVKTRRGEGSYLSVDNIIIVNGPFAN
jgi:CRISPR-associated protein (TIGR02584 family)